MDRIHDVIEAVRQSHQMPTFFPLLIGMFIIKRVSFLHTEDADIMGDNVPTSLMDGLNS